MVIFSSDSPELHYYTLIKAFRIKESIHVVVSSFFFKSLVLDTGIFLTCKMMASIHFSDDKKNTERKVMKNE